MRHVALWGHADTLSAFVGFPLSLPACVNAEPGTPALRSFIEPEQLTAKLMPSLRRYPMIFARLRVYHRA